MLMVINLPFANYYATQDTIARGYSMPNQDEDTKF